MNHRVLELLKTPKSIQSEDLNLLKEEINSFPYIQNIRALYLYGVHLYDKENYQKVLSTTAAYTTDKKILYQLINGKIQQKPKAEIPAETIQEKIIPMENPLQLLLRSKASVFPLKREEEPVSEDHPETVEETAEILADDENSFGIPPEPKPEAKEVFVNGERNRILFEGEENFLEDDNVEVIDLESTLESGSIITQKPDKKEEILQDQEFLQEDEDPEIIEAEDFTPETIIEEEKIKSESEKEEVLNNSELSFHETESFLPDVQITQNENENEYENTEEVADFTTETIVNEDRLSSSEEKETLHDDSELSFHGMESFLPDVKIQPNTDEKIKEISQPGFSKHEDEMRRLIEEVEKKMKEKAASETPKIEEESENAGNDISFSETQSFEVKTEEPKSEEADKESVIENNVQPEASEKQVEEISEENKAAVEQAPEVNTAWKPMSLESNLPDSLLSKPVENVQPQPEIPAESKAEAVQKEISEETGSLATTEIIEPVENMPAKPEELTESKEEDTAVEMEKENKEEAPVMNVSFFSSGWTIPQPEKKEQKSEIQQENTQKAAETASSVENVVENKKSSLLDSNVPGFINTWQSWLKIDRSSETKQDKTEVKNKVIETFIENNPKISQLKEESNFIIKEKGDDISHLMTETLANLYFEQKLYTKAIKAFETLIKKTPEKKEYYENRIQEIKDFRTKG
ncbi:hypothetical protein U9K52_11185 [Chryseobacterium sp. MHB01]|uniref:hypothetical protein n=1 Tax=Chryseobacterium sp. MHB01 TaxID=3109433 RepID=UPI002AFDCF2E|nr:hypothetical protein [Chryseobacterium sp. MHB01]MEA1849476.1 hypothetical protein [Chryseobacterium sp. MHB01]